MRWKLRVEGGGWRAEGGVEGGGWWRVGVEGRKTFQNTGKKAYRRKGSPETFHRFRRFIGTFGLPFRRFRARGVQLVFRGHLTGTEDRGGQKIVEVAHELGLAGSFLRKGLGLAEGGRGGEGEGGGRGRGEGREKEKEAER
jgi:hypothetical protein